MFIQCTYCGNMFKFPEKIDILKKRSNSEKKFPEKNLGKLENNIYL